MRGVSRALLACFLFVALTGLESGPTTTREAPCPDMKIGGTLPLPCSMPLGDYERVLSTWVNNREYTKLGWVKDKYVRDTGPFVLGANYGTHPAIRIYYSDEVHRWLLEGRANELPVGSMMIKEMFNPPAARLDEQRRDRFAEDSVGFEALVAISVTSWAIMIRDDQTLDSWFWAARPPVERARLAPSPFGSPIRRRSMLPLALVMRHENLCTGLG